MKQNMDYHLFSSFLSLKIILAPRSTAIDHLIWWVMAHIRERHLKIMYAYPQRGDVLSLSDGGRNTEEYDVCRKS